MSSGNRALQIIGTLKCKKTQKACRFFRDRGIDFHFRDLSQKALSPGEFKNIRQKISSDLLLDQESREFKKLNLRYFAYEPDEILLEHPLLLRTPVLRFQGEVTAGDGPESLKVWKSWAETIKTV